MLLSQSQAKFAAVVLLVVAAEKAVYLGHFFLFFISRGVAPINGAVALNGFTVVSYQARDHLTSGGHARSSNG